MHQKGPTYGPTYAPKGLIPKYSKQAYSICSVAERTVFCTIKTLNSPILYR